MKIREAKNEEAQIIANFQIDMAWETEEFKLSPEVINAGTKAVFEDSSKGKFFVAEIEGEIAGSLLITYEWSDWRNKTIVWIQSVYVRPEFRKMGVFKNLYLYIKKLVSETESYAGIKLYVDKSNVSAQKVYEKMGMNGEHYKLYEYFC